jgi:hypothetical protein
MLRTRAQTCTIAGGGLTRGLGAKGKPSMKIVFASPTVVDYGSISEHTFARAQIPSNICVPAGNPHQNKQGDWRICQLDKFCEYSCPS